MRILRLGRAIAFFRKLVTYSTAAAAAAAAAKQYLSSLGLVCNSLRLAGKINKWLPINILLCGGGLQCTEVAYLLLTLHQGSNPSILVTEVN